MGAESMGDTPGDTKFTDAKVCRNFLCGTCPHDLFTNTVCSVFSYLAAHLRRMPALLALTDIYVDCTIYPLCVHLSENGLRAMSKATFKEVER